MRSLARHLFTLLAFFSISLCALAQSTQKAGTGVLTGRITVGDKAVQGVTVTAVPGEYMPDRREAARSTTDYEGNYRLMGLPAGRYTVTPLAPTLISPSDNMYGGAGRFVIVGEGESIEKIDFALTRAGVITGRITDADGKPVIEERLQLNSADNSNRSRFGAYSNPFMYQTDDRGVYRIYGLPPGRYTLSVGVAPDDGMVRVGALRRGYYQRTFYPGETDIKRAGIIEVTEGGEVRDIDIKLGQRSQSFTIAGRVVDADTGRPLSNLLIGYGTYDQNAKRMTSFGFGQVRTDARGQFKLEGLVPGRFAAFVWSENETYSDPAPFEITDADISGLELKLRRGATISGIAQIEGTADKSVLARLSQLSLGASIQTSNLAPPGTRQVTISADGTFRMTGLPPGRASLFIYGYPQPKDIKLARVERDGTPQPTGIEVTPGAEIGNVRVIFEYGSGSVRGQLRVENGTLPEDARTFVFIQKPGDDPNARPVGYSQADVRGRFIVDGLPAGDYVITVRVQLPPVAGRGRLVMAKENVTVSNGMETEATVVLDLTDKAAEGKEQ
jgi:protocatechuate 3,4-dioxygenase beta subunit